MDLLEPSPQSLAFRANLASLVSPLRRLKPRVPFFRLPAHRIPTLWSWYRPLLRYAPTENIKQRVRRLADQNRAHVGVKRTRATLQTGYKWLDVFKRAHNGDEHLRAVLERWDRQLGYKNKQRLWRLQEHNALFDLAESQRRRPWLTGGFIRPSYFNKPLPRLKPQPINVSGMILYRRRAREKRLLRVAELNELRQDIRRERDFEQGVLALNSKADKQGLYTGPAAKEWDQPINHTHKALHVSLRRDDARAATPVSPSLMAQVKRARAAKHANQARAHLRERSGEILNRTLARRASRPPPPIWDKMSEERRHMDRVSRSVSEVGYVAKVKRQLGFKMRESEKWKVEEGRDEEEKRRLDRVYLEILKENGRRRRMAERASDERDAQ